MRTPRSRSASAFAPASITNLGMGFDVIGMALQEPGDTVHVLVEDRPETTCELRMHGSTASKLTNDPLTNTAAIAALATLKRAGVTARVVIDLHKDMPIGSGLGSSTASAAAAAMATNIAIGSPLRRVDLVEPCLDAEMAVSGRHADNAAAAIFGGLILVRSTDPVDVVRLPVPEGLMAVVVTPAIEILTKEARAVLPRTLPLEVTVRQMANLGAFASACFANDIDLLSRCIHDEIAEPVRTQLITGGPEVIAAARDAGALGSSVSGAGPSIFALCRSRDSARIVADAMVAAFDTAGVESSVVISPADCPGVRRL